jgi:hypothetical protein
MDHDARTLAPPRSEGREGREPVPSPVRRSPSRPVAIAGLLLAALAVAPDGGASAETVAWAPAGSASIHPGVQLVNLGAQCTAGFVLTESGHIFLAEAAHCLSTGTPRGAEGDGCTSDSLPLGTPVDIAGGRHRGTLVYSAWIAMHLGHETRPDLCTFNDLALVAVDPRDYPLVNPSVPVWGGPTALSPGVRQGEAVFGYGSSELWLGLGLLGPRQGQSVGDAGHGWSHDVVTAPPGTLGDPGSPFLDSHGAALGALASIEISPVPGSNGIGDLARELDYVRLHSRLSRVQLALGTEPFTGHR